MSIVHCRTDMGDAFDSNGTHNPCQLCTEVHIISRLSDCMSAILRNNTKYVKLRNFGWISTKLYTMYSVPADRPQDEKFSRTDNSVDLNIRFRVRDMEYNGRGIRELSELTLQAYCQQDNAEQSRRPK